MTIEEMQNEIVSRLGLEAPQTITFFEECERFADIEELRHLFDRLMRVAHEQMMLDE